MGMFIIKHEFSRSEINMRRSSIVALVKSEPLLAETRYPVNSYSPYLPYRLIRV